jgi:hypothetical protein
MSRIRLAAWLAWNALRGRTTGVMVFGPAYGAAMLVGVLMPPKCNCHRADVGHMPDCPLYDLSDYAGA